jgi:hypothetical protein
MPPPKRPTEHPPPDLDEGDLELTDDDIRWVRRNRKQDDHWQWVRGQVRVLWPYVVAVVGALVAAVTWIRDHVRL